MRLEKWSAIFCSRLPNYYQNSPVYFIYLWPKNSEFQSIVFDCSFTVSFVVFDVVLLSQCTGVMGRLWASHFFHNGEKVLVFFIYGWISCFSFAKDTATTFNTLHMYNKSCVTDLIQYSSIWGVQNFIFVALFTEVVTCNQTYVEMRFLVFLRFRVPQFSEVVQPWCGQAHAIREAEN